MKKRVLIVAPAFSATGYGEHARFVLRSLKQHEDKLELFLVPTRWGMGGEITTHDEEYLWMQSLVRKQEEYLATEGQKFDASVQVDVPTGFQRLSPLDIGVTAGIEADKMVPEWANAIQKMDKIVTPSEFAKNVIVDTKFAVHDNFLNKTVGEHGIDVTKTPVEVVHYPVKLIQPEPLELKLSTTFNLLTCVQWGPRKAAHLTIDAFYRAFRDDPNAGLIVKTFGINGSKLDRERTMNAVRNTVEHFRGKEGAKCKVYLLHGNLSEGQMTTLYRMVDGYVTTTHGEGFGLPIFEAAYNECPVIATDWSGHLDFLCVDESVNKYGKETPGKKRKMFLPVQYALGEVPPEQVAEKMFRPDAKWAYVNPNSVVTRMKDLKKDPNRFKSQAIKLATYLKSNFNQKKQYDLMANALLGDYLNMSDWLSELNKEIETV